MSTPPWETPTPPNAKYTGIHVIFGGIVCLLLLILALNIYEARRAPAPVSSLLPRQQRESFQSQVLAAQFPPPTVTTPDPTDFNEDRDGSNALSLEDENGKASIWEDKKSGARIFCMDSYMVLPLSRRHLKAK